MWTTLALFAAANICSHCFRFNPSGFSQITCLPFFTASMAISACEKVGVEMSTISMSGDSTISRQSVAACCQPSCARAAWTFWALRPQIVWSSTLALRVKNLGACLQAFECALPMKRYPISPTRKVFAIKVGVELMSRVFIVSPSNQVKQMPFTTAEIAKVVGGEVIGDSDAVLKKFATIESAQPGDLTFAENEEFFARAEQSAATAIIADKRFSSTKKILIQVPNARIAFARALALFFPDPKFSPGIHPTAVIANSAQVDGTAHIGPHCVVGERVQIGARTVLQAGNFVGDDSKIGNDTNLFPNAV